VRIALPECGLNACRGSLEIRGVVRVNQQRGWPDGDFELPRRRSARIKIQRIDIRFLFAYTRIRSGLGSAIAGRTNASVPT
jgi:hypothetical protein